MVLDVPRRVKMVVLQVRVATSLHWTTEADLLAQLAADADGRLTR